MSGKKTIRLPHVYILLMIVMLIVVALSWVVPSGEFARVPGPGGKPVVDPDNFSYVTEGVKSISLMDFFSAIHLGITNASHIIVLLLMAVGAIYLVEKSGAITAGIHRLLEVSGGKEVFIIGVLTFIFALLGAIGMGEGGLAFIPLAVSMVTALGFDKITGFATAGAGMAVGFASGVLNFYTTGVSQSIVGLPIYSGIGFRAVALVVFYLITMIYITRYARKTKADPDKSVMAEEYKQQLKEAKEAGEREVVELTFRRKIALTALAFVFVFQAYGAIKLGWGLPQLSALYIIFAIFVAVVTKMNPSQACNDFAYGAARVLPAALAIGIAASVMVLMSQARIVDTAIHGLAGGLEGKGSFVALVLIYLSVIAFNFFVVSGSGKAVIMMPLLGPLGQILHVNQQVMVLVYQYGDGFTNYIWPTSGALMAALALVNVDYMAWIRYSWKLFAILSTVAFGLIMLANNIGLGPF